MNNTGYILGISRGHNAGACLLKDGKIVFAVEEERLSRHKYDGGPYAAMMKVREYTDKLDFIVVSHTQTFQFVSQKVDYTGDNIYVGLARKLGLIDRKANIFEHPQVIDLAEHHHKIHASMAFYRSGFDEAVAVVIDGAGSCKQAEYAKNPILLWEVETIFDCSYPNNFVTLHKHYGSRDPVSCDKITIPGEVFLEENPVSAYITDRAGIVKLYEAVTEYCGFQGIEAGKTMGLFPYGKPNDKIPKLFNSISDTFPFDLVDRNIVVPTYPGSAFVNRNLFEFLKDDLDNPEKDLTKLQSRRDLAYALQTQTQEQALKLIVRASELSGKKNVVLSGGYGLNCVANYFYLEKLNELGIKLYVEPISNDGGTAIGAALWFYHNATGSKDKSPSDIYLGPKYEYTDQQISDLCEKYGATIEDADDEKIVDMLIEKNIVAMFQGRSENGPRALGNRSILFDPRFKDGKDFVNTVKRREYFRPFAGSILKEDVHEWFDLRGMEASPHMMYAVSCRPGVEEKIPSIIHVDGSCRIQTVAEQENPLYYRFINKFKEKTGVPIVFNTSFNLGGEPLVETLEDALWTLQQSNIEYLYIPEYAKLISIKNVA